MILFVVEIALIFLFILTSIRGDGLTHETQCESDSGNKEMETQLDLCVYVCVLQCSSKCRHPSGKSIRFQLDIFVFHLNTLPY